MIFFDLLHPSPQMKILAVSSHADFLLSELADFLQPHNGSMDIALYPGEHQEVSNTSIARRDTLKDYTSPPRSTSRDYEAVIVQDVLHLHTLPLKFLQLIYRSMENSAEVIIVQKKGVMETSDVEALLEQSEFRAPNSIDDLIEGYDVIVAKKMHMWGAGL